MHASARLAILALTAFAAPALAQAGNVTIPKDANQPADASKPAESKQKRIDLRPKFKEGDIHKFQVSIRSKAVQAQSGKGKDKQDDEQVSNNDITLRLRVVSAGEDGASLEVTYETIRFEVKNEAMEITFDSTKPAANDDPLTDSLLRPLVGLKLQLQTDKNGNITKIDSGAAGTAVPGNIMSSFTGADVVRRIFGPITTIKAGDGFAAVGDTWTNESNMAGSSGSTGAMRTKLNYTLRSHSGESAKLGIEGKVDFDGGSALPVTIKDSSISGTADWNTQRGMLEAMNLTQRMVVETTLLIPDNVLDDNASSTPQTTVQQTTMTVKRIQ